MFVVIGRCWDSFEFLGEFDTREDAVSFIERQVSAEWPVVEILTQGEFEGLCAF